MLGCLVVVAVLAWPAPSLSGWGALTIGLLVTLLLWLAWRTVAGERTVPGHPVQWVLLGPAAILACHLGRESLFAQSGTPVGALSLSMLFQLCLLSGGVMLSQSLLPLAARHVGVLSICGAAMMISPLAARISGGPAAEPMLDSLALLGFAGVGIWLSSLWGVGWRGDPWPDDEPTGRGDDAPPIQIMPLRIAVIATAVLAAVWLTWVSPRSAILAGGVLGIVCLLGGLVFRQDRILMLAAGAMLIAGEELLGTALHVPGVAMRLVGAVTQLSQVGLFGLGEAAFGYVGVTSSGLTVLAWTIGWGGACCMAGGWAVCVVWLLTGARRRRIRDRRRAMVWTWATALSSCAMLSVGGLFAPAMVAAAALTWGLLPQMLGRPRKVRSGILVLLVVVALAVVVGVARNRGLIQWAMHAVVGGPRVDKWMHLSLGAVLTMTLAWVMGARRAWLGLVGIALAAAAGGLGELMQLVSRGTVDINDWIAHLYGCALATGPYLLCIGARWCESPELKRLARAGEEAYL